MFVLVPSCLVMLPGNVPWNEPMFNHFLWCSSICNIHVCIPVLWGFWWRPCLPAADWKMANSPLCKFLNRLHLVKHDFYWIFDVIHPLHLVLISHQISGRYLSLTNVELVHQILFAYPITISFTPWFHYLLIAETTSFFRALFMFLTRW